MKTRQQQRLAKLNRKHWGNASPILLGLFILVIYLIVSTIQFNSLGG